MEVSINCKEIIAGGNKKLVFDDFYFDEDWPLYFCAHGMKLRWSCDYCEEHFDNINDEVHSDGN